MRYIKTFETYDPSLSFPMTTKEFLTSFYKCSDCHSVAKSFNQKNINCRYCGSRDTKISDREQYYDFIKRNVEDPEELNDIIYNQEREDQELVNLSDLKDEDDYEFNN